MYFRLFLKYCSPFTNHYFYVALSLIDIKLIVGLAKSSLDVLTKQDVATLSLHFFTLCTLTTGQMTIGVIFSSINTMSPTSIQSTVEYYFWRFLNVCRTSLISHVQNLFMTLLTLIHNTVLPLWMLLFRVSGGSAVIPVKQGPDDRLLISPNN